MLKGATYTHKNNEHRARSDAGPVFVVRKHSSEYPL